MIYAASFPSFVLGNIAMLFAVRRFVRQQIQNVVSAYAVQLKKRTDEAYAEGYGAGVSVGTASAGEA